MSEAKHGDMIETAKALSTNVLGFAVGGLLGFLASLYGRYTAKAAVEVRPNLAEVGFVKAAVTQHGVDWLFYHFSVAMSVAMALIGATMLGGIGLWRAIR